MTDQAAVEATIRQLRASDNEDQQTIADMLETLLAKVTIARESAASRATADKLNAVRDSMLMAATEAAGAAARERDAAKAEVSALTETRDRHLALIAKLTRETPYPAELDECRSARAALIAEVGTLRSEAVQLEAQLADSRRGCETWRQAHLGLRARLADALGLKSLPANMEDIEQAVASTAAIRSAARDYRDACRDWQEAETTKASARANAKRGAAASRIITAMDELEPK